ncbi:transposable element Tcb1 transposase [Trichonephila clavipes]|nr:transposable element Tcb1 transposase [Trichonephila clavipes]
MGAEFLFMDDNARPHRANIVDECLQSEDITRMDWPAYSPDLNPIEHVWDMLGRRIAARQPPPTCLPELRRTLLDEWCNTPQDQVDNLILSMPRHSVWIPGHCGVTGKEFADHVSKKRGSFHSTDKESCPSAKRIIKKKMKDLSSIQYTLREIPIRSGGINLRSSQAVDAEFRLATGHDYLFKHLHRIHVAQAPFCTLCDSGVDMDADHIRRCPALKGSSLDDPY